MIVSSEQGETPEAPIGSESTSETSKQSQTEAAPFERWLDKKLKAVYGSVLEEAIPQDIVNLLRQRLDENR